MTSNDNYYIQNLVLWSKIMFLNMKQIRNFIKILFAICFIQSISTAQKPFEKMEKTVIDGKVVSMLITESDTIILANLDEVYISSKAKFASDQEYLLYMRYRAYAAKVYPYAVEAIRIYRAYQDNVKELNFFKKRKTIKNLQNELEKEFEDPLKNLTKGQGRILLKMIERETGESTYNIIKDIKGGFSAFYWNTTSSFWGYHLKDAYKKGDDPILDMVLEDFEVTRSLD